MRIIIVDDEAVHLMNLIGVIQIHKPSYIIFSAKDGRQALDILETFQVDMLITDIRMPNMDGLTLIEHAKKIQPELHTIVLSGYGEFEYAQRGIELDIDNYLLKMLDPEELLRIMDGLEWKIKSRQEQRRSEQTQREVIEKVKQDQLELDSEMLVLGYAGEQGAQEIRALIRNFPSGVIACIKARGASWNRTTVDIWKERVTSFARMWGDSYTFRCTRASGTIVTLLNHREVPDRSFFTQCASYFAAFGDDDYVIGISSFFYNLLNHVELAYHQATEACEYAFYLPEIALHQYMLETPIQPFLLGHIRLPIESAKDSLLNGSAAKAAELLIQDTQGYIANHRPYPSKLKEVLMFCFWHISCAVGNIISKEDLHCLVTNIDQLITSSRNMQELNAAIRSACDQFCAMLNHQRKSVTDQAMEAAAAILREQYTRDWSLAALAECVHFNPSYFSSLFKQHFGIGYSDYLNDVRMEKAVEMLKSGNLQIGQLASAVGYQNTAYFIRSFRKKYGVTPNEFRRGVGGAFEKK